MRFGIAPLVMLDFEDALPIDKPAIWNALFFKM
jgi:hypothetical protein